jgi:hypothetical protein
MEGVSWLYYLSMAWLTALVVAMLWMVFAH